MHSAVSDKYSTAKGHVFKISRPICHDHVLLTFPYPEGSFSESVNVIQCSIPHLQRYF